MIANLLTKINPPGSHSLHGLPYDSGAFDFVHIRLIGLGIPESKWVELLEEAARVLKLGGKLEIVETSYTLPPATPTSLQNSFYSVLQADSNFYLSSPSRSAYLLLEPKQWQIQSLSSHGRGKIYQALFKTPY